MSFFDKARDAAKKAVDQHGDKIREATDKAGDMIDKQTKGQHTDKIVKGKAKVREGLDKLDDQGNPPPPGPR